MNKNMYNEIIMSNQSFVLKVKSVIIKIFFLVVWFLPVTSFSKGIVNMKKVKLHEFFPYIGGNIRTHSIEIPSNFELDATQDGSVVGFLWGTKNDLKNWKNIPNVKDGIIRVRFTPNVGLGNDGMILGADRASIEKIGLSDLVYKSGNYKGIKGVPVVAFSGKSNSNLLYMLYLYSPADNVVMLANLQGAKSADSANVIWNAFVGSFDIK